MAGAIHLYIAAVHLLRHGGWILGLVYASWAALLYVQSARPLPMPHLKSHLLNLVWCHVACGLCHDVWWVKVLVVFAVLLYAAWYNGACPTRPLRDVGATMLLLGCASLLLVQVLHGRHGGEAVVFLGYVSLEAQTRASSDMWTAHGRRLLLSLLGMWPLITWSFVFASCMLTVIWMSLVGLVYVMEYHVAHVV